MKAVKGIIVAGILALSCGTGFAEKANELHLSPRYQEHERAAALLYNAPAAIQACVWAGSFRHTWTQDEARDRIVECQRSRDDYLLKQAIRNWLPVFAVVISLALVIGLRGRIAAGVYNLLVSFLAFGIRVKRLFALAIKEAGDRTH